MCYNAAPCNANVMHQGQAITSCKVTNDFQVRSKKREKESNTAAAIAANIDVGAASPRCRRQYLLFSAKLGLIIYKGRCDVRASKNRCPKKNIQTHNTHIIRNASRETHPSISKLFHDNKVFEGHFLYEIQLSHMSIYDTKPD